MHKLKPPNIYGVNIHDCIAFQSILLHPFSLGYLLSVNYYFHIYKQEEKGTSLYFLFFKDEKLLKF